MTSSVATQPGEPHSPPLSTNGLFRECLGRAVAVGALLGFVDTAFTYTTGHAPFADVALIIAVPLVVLTAVGLLVLALTVLSGRVYLAPRVVEAALLIAPVALFGARGCLVECERGALSLALRAVPTVILVAGLAYLAARRPSTWGSRSRLLISAAISQTVAAVAFGLRTDEYPQLALTACLIGGVLTIVIAIASRIGKRGWVAKAAPVLAVALLCAGSVTVAWFFRSMRPRLSAMTPTGVSTERPNVLLIVLDTVRADHLSLHGYRRRTSPNLDAFAAESLVFDRARANASYSLASHASLFTGLAPSRHGARPIPNSWLRQHPTLDLASRNFRLRSEVPTLAEDLKQLGYATAGISGNYVFLGRWTGLQRGFDSFFEATPLRHYRFYPLSAPTAAFILPRLGVTPIKVLETWRAPEITRAAIDWLTSAPAPFFLFINYFDAHAPYEPPGGTPFLRDGLGRDGEVAAYDGAIASLDVELGRLLRFMRDSGLLDRTLVVITSDHGEYFGEHGLLRHIPVLYEPVLRVPLVVRVPGGALRGRVARWTGLHEVRTLVREVSGSTPSLTILKPRNVPTVIAQAWAGESPEAEPSSTAIYFEDFKLLVGRSERDELFDVAKDPGEKEDLLLRPTPATLEVHARMRSVIAGKDSTRMGDNPEASSDAVERLRALGYIQ